MTLMDQGLSYDESLSGQPGHCFVKKRKNLIWLHSQNFKKYLILKFKMISRTCFVFMIAFTVYE